LSSDYVLASASIPVFFPPVKLGGDFYGDGGIRQSAPLSPAIHMDADWLVAIGIRCAPTFQMQEDTRAPSHAGEIALGDVVGTLLNALFFDSLDTDLERIQRVNRTLSLMTPDQLAKEPDGLRQVPILAIRPSRDLGTLASEQFDRFPLMLRHMLKGLGASGKKGWDLLSYLAFDRIYVQMLLDLGRRDALAQREQIAAFLAQHGDL
jgi:NTE family protein